MLLKLNKKFKRNFIRLVPAFLRAKRRGRVAAECAAVCQRRDGGLSGFDNNPVIVMASCERGIVRNGGNSTVYFDNVIWETRL